MCAIVDASVVHEVFGPEQPPAGRKFRNWIDKGSLRLVAGGRALEELDAHGHFRKWRAIAVQTGKIRIVARERIDARMRELQDAGSCTSDDEHIISLAQLSGARLLYSNDVALRDDFRNRDLLDRPKGKVYSTLVSTAFGRAHQRLLADNTLCRVP